jgi:transposase-like protein
MELRLRKNARTAPAVRAEIAASTEGVSALARRYGVGRATVRKWKHRADPMDRSHTAHHLQTAMNSGQETIAVYLRRHFLLPRGFLGWRPAHPVQQGLKSTKSI